MPYNSALEELQWARESTPGTDLAATSKVLCNFLRFTPQSEFYRPPVVRGLIQRNRGFETAVKRWTRWAAEGPANYEQLQNWLSGAVVDVASPTGVGPYVWTHTRNPAAIPTLATYTLERRETDGSTPIDHVWHYAMVEKLKLSFVDGGPLMFSAEGFARRLQTGETRTASLALPTPEIPPAPLSRVWVDSTWANLGTTQVSSQVLRADVEFNTGAYPIWTSDNRSDLDFTLHGINQDQVFMTAKLVLLLGAQYATERAAAEAGTLRAVRVQFDGTSSRQLQIDFLGKYDLPELFEFGDENGQKIVELNLVESTDGTNLTTYKLTNNISAYV